jgi:hypothetical protein
MQRTLVLGLLAATLAVAPAAAVPHGKPGLWKITSVMQMSAMPQLPPQVMAMMKKRGMPMPGQANISQICMTQEDVSGSIGEKLAAQHQVNCTPHILSQTATSATTEVVCHGAMEGTGHSQISWRGDNHYDGSYSFKGNMHGQSNDMSTQYSGDWVKSDCGAVKPFSAKGFETMRRGALSGMTPPK